MPKRYPVEFRQRAVALVEAGKSMSRRLTLSSSPRRPAYLWLGPETEAQLVPPPALASRACRSVYDMISPFGGTVGVETSP